MKNRILLAYYGDDFTGSTDAMEALTIHGLDNVLFLETPNSSLLNEFKEVQCIGIAGTARAKTTKGMKSELDPIFKSVATLNPQYFHYKICSTFDSSPSIGSIGFAADLARNYFNNPQYNVLVGVPQLGRYTVFGHHFAKKDETVYRLDRHPVMSVHPVTPMHEADLKKHLSKQTNQSIGNVTIHDLKIRDIDGLKELTSISGEDIIIFDALEEQDLDSFADYLNILNKSQTQFIIGSSGVEYAIGKYWGNKERINRKDQLAEESHRKEKKSEEEKTLVVSGSLSEITSEQMHYAIKQGFKSLQIPVEIFNNIKLQQEFIDKVSSLLDKNNKLIIYTADGPQDKNIKSTIESLEKINENNLGIGELIGVKLGEITNNILKNNKINKLVISGGDTSGFVMKELGVYALKVHSTISPGAPLCKVFSHDKKVRSLKIALKGGQLGGKDYYKKIADY